MIHFDAVTLFPEMFDAITRSGVTRRAFENGVYELVLWNPRDFSTNAYRSVDDRPYGGGPGMVMMPEPLERALRAARQRQKSCGVKDPKVDALIDQAMTETDTAAREKLWVEVDKATMAGAYYIPGIWAKGLLYRPPNLTNVFVTNGTQMYEYLALGTTNAS